jgi:hypothetical protein
MLLSEFLKDHGRPSRCLADCFPDLLVLHAEHFSLAAFPLAGAPLSVVRVDPSFGWIPIPRDEGLVQFRSLLEYDRVAHRYKLGAGECR